MLRNAFKGSIWCIRRFLFSTTTVRMGPKKPNQKSQGNPKEEAGTSRHVPRALSKVQGGISMNVHAKPKAKSSAITGVDDEAVYVQLGAQARDGDANAELVQFVAKILKVKKGKVSLITGHKSRDKRILIETEDDIEEIQDVLTKAIE